MNYEILTHYEISVDTRIAYNSVLYIKGYPMSVSFSIIKYYHAMYEGQVHWSKYWLNTEKKRLHDFFIFMYMRNGNNVIMSNSSRMIAFGTVTSLKRVYQSEVFYMDGTFNTCPTAAIYHPLWSLSRIVLFASRQTDPYIWTIINYIKRYIIATYMCLVERCIKITNNAGSGCLLVCILYQWNKCRWIFCKSINHTQCSIMWLV